MPRSLLLLLLLLPSVSHAQVTIDWVTVGDPGNACEVALGDSECRGGVAEPYRIGRTEVTVAQYTAFLNAVAREGDPNELWSPSMALTIISVSGTASNLVYNAVAGPDQPIRFVSFWDAMRFANWLHNGQPTTGVQDASTTEDGAYTITSQGLIDNTITRNPGARVFVPNDDEWYKAAYYDPTSGSFFEYAMGSDALPTCSAPTGTSNTAYCGNPSLPQTVVDVGSYPGSPSPIGTFDQGGNVWEWNESTPLAGSRGVRGGGYNSTAIELGKTVAPNNFSPQTEGAPYGFRVASVVPPPVPMLAPGALGVVSALLLAGGSLALRGRR